MSLAAPRPGTLSSPISLPRARIGTVRQERESAQGFTLLACGALACAAVAYIGGFASMTWASRHQIVVQKQIRIAQAERQILHSKLVDLSREVLIREWATKRKMAIGSGAPVFIGIKSQKGR